MSPINRFPTFPSPGGPSSSSGSASSQVSARSRGNNGSSEMFSLGIGPTTQSSKPSSLPDLLVDQLRGVNSAQTGADAMVHSLITGGDVNEAEVLTAVQKADLAFRMMLQIRNKLMDAYREIQQIQI